MTLRQMIVPVLWLLFASPAWAQFETASVVGTVRDSSGAVVPGAAVTLTAVETGVSTSRTTNDSGLYEFVTVRAGLYIVTAEKAGFSSALVDNLQVQVGGRQRVDLSLEVGRVSERIQVTASSPLVEHDSSQRGQVITGDQIRQLALNGREYSVLALMSPGVRQSALMS